MLSDKIKHYQEHKEMLYNTPAQYKQEFAFLKEVDSLALTNVQMNLEQAYKNFFGNPKIGFPKFKKKSYEQSYTTNCQYNGTKPTIEIHKKHIKLPKVGYINAKIYRNAPDFYKLKSATITEYANGTFYVSILYEYEDNVQLKKIDIKKSIGLDYKSDALYKDSNNELADMPRYYKLAQKELAKHQRRLSRKVKKSNNYHKQRIVVAKRHTKTKNQRLDFLNKKSYELAEKYDLVCVEDLNMKGIAQSIHLGKSTNDNGYGIFLRMLDYKLYDRGKLLIKIDKWFASSQLCHNCGYKNPETKDLNLREWDCPQCGHHNDRDHNAALNIRDEGIRIYKEGFLNLQDNQKNNT